MASLAAACRLSARLTARQLRQDASHRGFRTSANSLAAQNFTMPALSPTMTEGNIASWKIKEGDSFVAGDVILEIETDKASMDVEAQDDGILAKITLDSGSKGIKVGTRIGVIAEPGDDISSLEIPAEETASAPEPESKSSAPMPEPSKPAASSAKSASSNSGPAKKQTYPLLPSVEHLIHQHGLDASVIDKMTPTGPNNRLLKGDVLAYLGSISESYPAELTNRLEKLSHLDLSNIKLAEPKAAAKPAKAAAEVPLPSTPSEVALPISLTAVLEAQSRLKTQLGITMPLSTFIARATDIANDDLPRPAGYTLTADELFDQVLGLETGSTSSRGSYLPQITSASLASLVGTSRRSTPESDIIDILTGPRKPSPKLRAVFPASAEETVNLFSVTVPQGDERRAQVFLERVKTVLETEPGRLVL